VEQKHTIQYAMGDQSVLAPVYELTETPVVRPSGACMQLVIQKQYSNYQVAALPNDRTTYQGANDATSVSPNPATDEVVVRTGAGVSEGSSLYISDITGRQVYQQKGAMPSSEYILPIHNLEPGLYFIRLETKTGSQTFKITKKNDQH
jgi:hypothetical protein